MGYGGVDGMGAGMGGGGYRPYGEYTTNKQANKQFFW